jgi:hypothetical protein
MRNPGLRANLFLDLNDKYQNALIGLKTLEGVSDFYTNESENLIVIKYDSDKISEDSIKDFLDRS